MEDSHAAIVSKSTFDMVQQEFKNRGGLRSASTTGHGKYSSKYAFSGIIICGECGETYRRHQQYNQYKKYPTCACKRHENMGAEYCEAMPLKETAIEKTFLRALNGLIENREEILDKLQKAVVSEMSDSCAEQITSLNRRIEAAQEDMVNRLKEKQDGRITPTEYDREGRGLMLKIDELNLQREALLSEQSRMQLAEYRVDAVTKLFATGKILDEFDKTIFKSLVRQIKVIGDKEIEFECGIKLKERME